MSNSRPKRMKSSVFKSSDLSLFEHFSEERKTERLKRFSFRNLETHKSIFLHWFVDSGFEFPHSIISQNLEKFCYLSGNIYPLLVKKFYANLREDGGCWITEVNGIRIKLDLGILEEIGGLKNSDLGMNDVNHEIWNSFNPDASFASCLRLNKVPYERKAELLKVNIFLLHYVIVHILLPRSANQAQPNDEDMWYIFALKNGIHINWAEVVMNHMLRRFNDPIGALPYPMLVSKIIESAGVDTTHELKMALREKVSQIDRFLLPKMRIVRVGHSWEWLEDIVLQHEQSEREEELSGAEADASQVPPFKIDLMAQLQEIVNAQSRQLKSHVDERLSRIEERIEHGITLLKTLLGSRESTSCSSSSES